MQGVTERRLSIYRVVTRFKNLIEQLAEPTEDVFIIETPWIVLDMEDHPFKILAKITYYIQRDPEQPGMYTIERPYREIRHVTLEAARAEVTRIAEHAESEGQNLTYFRAR